MFTNVEVFSRNEPEVTKAFRFTDQHRKVIFIIITFLGVFREKFSHNFLKYGLVKKQNSVIIVLLDLPSDCQDIKHLVFLHDFFPPNFVK